MKRTNPSVSAQFCKCDWLTQVRFNQATDLLRHLYLRIQHSRLTRMAAQARAKAGLFGAFGQLEK
jgi:hypothetical protein